MNPKFYVYELWNPLKDQPFYVGKGKRIGSTDLFKRPEIHLNTATGKLKRPQDFNKHKLNTIKKIISMGMKPVVKIIFVTDDEKEAFDKEKELTKFYGRADLGRGCLTNLTDGGDGGAGRIWSISSKKKVSNTHRKNGGTWMKGKKHKAYSISLMKASHKKHPTVYQVTQETKNLISKQKKESYQNRINPFFHINQIASKPVLQINTDGVIIRKWSSIHEASRSLGYCPSNIIQTIKNGDKRPTLAHGHYWRYEDDSSIENKKLKNVIDLNQRRLSSTSKAIKILQSDLEGNIIKIWPSSSAVEKALGLRYQYIYEIIKGKKKSNIVNGYRWSPYQ